MALTTDRDERAKLLAGIGKMLPDLFGVFDAQQLNAIYINPAGLKRLDTKGTAALEKLALTDLIGINDIDRFHREIYPQARVLGSWSGLLVLRDFLGSEFTGEVKLVEIPAISGEGGRCLCLHARESTQEHTGKELISDPDMLNALLEASPNGIYFKDNSGRFLRVNLTLAKKFGLESPHDAIGKTDFDFFTSEHAAPAFEDEQRILKTNEPLIDHEEKETFGDGTVAWVSTTKFPFRNREGKLIGTYGISRDITARKMADEKLRMLSLVVEQSPISILITDTQGRIEYVNPYAEKVTGYSAAEMIGQNPRVLKSGQHPPEFYQEMWASIAGGQAWSGELQNRKKSGETFWENESISALRNRHGQITHYIAVKEDITARKVAEAERREMEARLQLSSKMESVGSLAAGVAHEINTPTQFISDNVRFLIGAFTQINQVLASHRTLLEHAAAHPECSAARAAVVAAETENELDYLVGEIPNCLEQSLDGLRRIAKIVGSLKEFSHPGGDEKSEADLNRAIETTVAVSRHEWKYVADVVTELDPNLPTVPCVIDEINQAVLNLVVNACHTIEDALKQRGETRGLITIRTKKAEGYAIIEVQDTGTGIPEHVRGRIFEPFFTTKGVGRGTGQGLAIVHTVITKKHHGSIDFTTEMGKGTTFRLSLPLATPQNAESGGSHQPQAGTS